MNENFSSENDLAAFYKSLNESQKLQFMKLINNFNPNKIELVLDSLANPKNTDNKLLKLNKIDRSYLDRCIRECREIWTAGGFNIDPKPFYDYIEDILVRNLNRTGQLIRMSNNQINKELVNNKKRYPEFKKQYIGDMPVEDIMNDILSATSDFLTGNPKFDRRFSSNFSERIRKCFSNTEVMWIDASGKIHEDYLNIDDHRKHMARRYNRNPSDFDDSSVIDNYLRETNTNHRIMTYMKVSEAPNKSEAVKLLKESFKRSKSHK